MRYVWSEFRPHHPLPLRLELHSKVSEQVPESKRRTRPVGLTGTIFAWSVVSEVTSEVQEIKCVSCSAGVVDVSDSIATKMSALVAARLAKPPAGGSKSDAEYVTPKDVFGLRDAMGYGIGTTFTWHDPKFEKDDKKGDKTFYSVAHYAVEDDRWWLDPQEAVEMGKSDRRVVNLDGKPLHRNAPHFCFQCETSDPWSAVGR